MWFKSYKIICYNNLTPNLDGNKNFQVTLSGQNILKILAINIYTWFKFLYEFREKNKINSCVRDSTFPLYKVCFLVTLQIISVHDHNHVVHYNQWKVYAFYSAGWACMPPHCLFYLLFKCWKLHQYHVLGEWKKCSSSV